MTQRVSIQNRSTHSRSTLNYGKAKHKKGNYKEALQKTTEVLLNDGLAVLPTDTVYGLAALGKSKTAREKLLALKPRPENRPIGFLISSSEELFSYGEKEIVIPPQAMELVKQHWPGGLTIIFKRSVRIFEKSAQVENDPPRVSPASLLAAGDPAFGADTVAIRCPNHPWLNELLAVTGPLATTSANLHNAPVPVSLKELAKEIEAGADILVDGGELTQTASTIVEITDPTELSGQAEPKGSREDQKLRILRQGELKL